MWVLTAIITFCGCRREADPKPLATTTTRDNPTGHGGWFTEITREVGLDFVHETGARGDLLLMEIMAAGAALFDFDNDGDLDIYLTSGHSGLMDNFDGDAVTNRLFRQEADGRFVDVTSGSGLDNHGYGMGVAIGDIDNDGDLDLYATNLGRDHLYRNRGDGTFEDVTHSMGVDMNRWSTSAAFFDYDRDGRLDLYVAHYVQYDPGRKCFDFAGRPDYCGPQFFTPAVDVLLHNEGDGAFTDVSDPAGITSVTGPGLGVVCEDFNEDGWIDVYVANDTTANQLWINQGDGTFQDEALFAGTAYNLHGVPEGGMGVIAADFDNDLHADLFVTHFVEESNTLYGNLGGQSGFTDISGVTGLGWPSVPYTGFGTAAFDADLDGDLDIAVVNGRVMRAEPLPGNGLEHPWNLFAEPNSFYLNDGTGSFSAPHGIIGAFCESIEITRALAVGDIDNDGDVDMLVTNVQGPARLYRNDVTRRGHWLTVRAIDPRLGRDAIGARVTIVAGDRQFVRTIMAAFSYLSSSDPRAHFGLGDITKIERIDVRWPDGLIESFPPTPVDRQAELIRGTGRNQP